MNKEEQKELFREIAVVLAFPETPTICTASEYRLGWEMCASTALERMRELYRRTYPITIEEV